MTVNKIYKQDINFIEGLSNIPRTNYLLGIKDRKIFIERTKKFLNLVGNPEDKMKFIHITGTSGKGTTVKVLQSLMASTKLKVGAYTSPFSSTTIEKVTINDALMDPRDLHRIIENKIKPAWDKYVLKYKDDPISYFETWLAIALLYFQEKKCDWVILEAGLGGSQDATNVITNTKVAAITNIGLDHMEILGNTKTKIATDKAGIIKKNCLFLTTEKSKTLLNIFNSVCKTKKAWNIKLQDLVKDYNTDNYFQTKKQKENLNLALNILDVLKIKPQNPQKIIDDFKLICRQEIIQHNPLVILDGSHNRDKLANLIEFVKQQKYKKLYLVLGFAHNKNYHIPFKKLLKISDKVYLTRFLVYERKSAELRKLYQLGKKLAPKMPISIHHDPYQALDLALKSASKQDLVLITGSFLLTGELRKKWVDEDYIIENLKLDKK